MNLNKFIELIKNTLHIYSAKTYKDGSIVFCDYIKKRYHYIDDVKLEYEVPYVDNKQHGISKGYYESGKLMAEIPYNKDKKHGIAKGYYENGQLKYEIPYVNDKTYGIYKEYDENGQLKYETL